MVLQDNEEKAALAGGSYVMVWLWLRSRAIFSVFGSASTTVFEGPWLQVLCVAISLVGFLLQGLPQ